MDQRHIRIRASTEERFISLRDQELLFSCQCLQFQEYENRRTSQATTQLNSPRIEIIRQGPKIAFKQSHNPRGQQQSVDYDNSQQFQNIHQSSQNQGTRKDNK